MNILDLLKKKKPEGIDIDYYDKEAKHAYDMLRSWGGSFDGETDTLQFGDTHVYTMDYYTLRERSWQLYAENELIKTIIDRLVTFTIGQGLKLQAQPESNVLKDLGVSENLEKWVKQVESYFKVYANSKKIDYANQETLSGIEKQVFLNTLVGGDCLVIERIDKDNKWLAYQVIDGSSIETPPEKKINMLGRETGNMIINGVEINKKGQHVAYYVKSSVLDNKGESFTANIEYKRIMSKSSKTKRTKAFMVYAGKYRSSQTRGLPLIGVCMQKAKQIDRYSKAEIASAEMNASFVATVEHEDFSSGENPFTKSKLIARNNRSVTAPEAKTAYSTDSVDKIAGKITRAIKGTVVNLGLGQKLKSYDTNRPSINYTLFVDAVSKYICSACEIPWEVALMVFGSNFSASRASTKMFEEILLNRRHTFSKQFNQRVYESFLIYYHGLGYLKSDGFLEAYISRNIFKLEAFFQARFFGKPIPHIDPKKEVESSILKLDNGLSTYEKETEMLGLGDFEDNAKRLKKEKEQIDIKEKTTTTTSKEEEDKLKEEEEDND